VGSGSNCSHSIRAIPQQDVGQLPWGHVPVLLDKLESPEDRGWYVSAAIEYEWSRNVLMNMIMYKTLERTGAAPSNFVQRLVGPDSETRTAGRKGPQQLRILRPSGELAKGTLRTHSRAGSPKRSANSDPSPS
jgi:hypothetical protein